MTNNPNQSESVPGGNERFEEIGQGCYAYSADGFSNTGVVIGERGVLIIDGQATPEHVARGFCPDCGTPLTYEAPDGAAVAIGAFDEPERVEPVIQYGVEAKLPYADGIAGLPMRKTEEDSETAKFLASVVSYQHPDHDTDDWPPV